VDQNTLLRLKGKFARVCVHIDITEPLPGSLLVAFEGRSMKIPLIYEGLHEVCALCGTEDHQIDSCSLILSQPQKEVRIGKFGTSSVTILKNPVSLTAPSKHPISATDNWIRVSPKKRVRSSQVKSSRFTTLVSSTPKIIIRHPSPPLSPIRGQSHHSTAASSEQGSQTSVLPILSDIQGPADPAPTDPLPGMGDDAMEDSPSPLAEGSPSGLVPEEEFADTFLNLEPFHDLEMSTDSTKRKRKEEGDECLSKLQH